ncbi:MAG: undecaprenyl-diphosphate phosphatase [Clostridia bacterium]|nr:undecaprenyl-diphosphate phosphatase [Clostridia bacterium]
MVVEFLEILKVILLGIVEGITEWLPISSTGHMLLLDELFTLNLREEFKEMFFVVIQLGAILAVVVLFFKKLFPLYITKEETETEDGLKTVKPKLNADMGILNLWGKVLVACLPAAVLGILFDDLLEEYLHTPLIIALTLILYGVAFIWIENRNKNRELPIKTTDEISYKQALIIGAFQVLSLIPGTSRSGATILGALLIGVSRPAGAEFTFFLAIPVMVGASAIKLLKFFLDAGAMTAPEIGYLLIGAIVAFAVSMVAIKFLMDFVKKHDFKVFGWYRIGLGAVVVAAVVIPALIG